MAKKSSVIEVDGITIDLDEVDMDSYEFVCALGSVNKGNIYGIDDLFVVMFDDDWERIKKELRGDNKKLKMQTVTDFFTHFMQAANLKNSSGSLDSTKSIG